MQKTAVCSIASKNFLAHSRTLFNSVRFYNPDVDLFLFLCDEVDGMFNPEEEIYCVIEAKNLGLPNFTSLSFKYDIIELNVSLKPCIIKHLFDCGYDKVLYFDSDVMVFNKLDQLINELDENSIIITPHITRPIPIDGLFPTEQLILSNGVYNLGFIGLRRSTTALDFLCWWNQKCSELCYRETESSLFVDQIWINFLPSLFDSVKIIKNKAYNMAYWNMHERKLSSNLLINDEEELIFFHFSGLDLNNIDSISKYQNRYSLQNRPDVIQIFSQYKEFIFSNGYEKVKDWKCRYNYFDNGERIGLLSRRIFSSFERKFPDPFSIENDSFYHLLKRKKILEGNEIRKKDTKNFHEKEKVLQFCLRLIKKMLGVDSYIALMKYLQYISILRRQFFLVE